MYKICLWAGGLALAGVPLHAGDSRLLNADFLAQLRDEAAQHHPTALAGWQEAVASGHEVRSVRLWNDPMIGVGFMGAKETSRADEGDVMLGFEQALPKPGMFAAERQKMEAMHRAAIENASGASLTAGAMAAKAAIELALADEAIALQEAQVHWMEETAKTARQMVADPMGQGADALRMQVELEKETQMLAAARRSRDAYATNLNLALGRSADAPWPELKLPAEPLPVPIARAEIARIPRANPKVRAMMEMAQAAKADARIADRESLPELAVGVDTRLYSATGNIRSTTVGIKMSLPWFNDPAYQAKIHAAKHRESAASESVEAMRREVASMVAMAAAEAANAAAQSRAYAGEIDHNAEMAVETTKAAWTSSRASLTDLLDAFRMRSAIRLEQRRMTAMQLASLEDLNSLVPNR